MIILDETELADDIAAKLVELGVSPDEARAHVAIVMKTVHSAYVSAMLAIDFHVDEMPKMQRTSGRDLVLQLLLGRLNAEVQENRADLSPNTRYTSLDLGVPNNE